MRPPPEIGGDATLSRRVHVSACPAIQCAKRAWITQKEGEVFLKCRNLEWQSHCCHGDKVGFSISPALSQHPESALPPRDVAAAASISGSSWAESRRSDSRTSPWTW